jgi:DNA-binding protein YbaB
LFSDAFGGALGRLAHPHTYAGAGDVTLQLTVTDDDAGAGSQSIDVSVLTPEQALEAIVDTLDALIAAASSDAQRAALARARDKLVSNNLGDAANGALDMLAKGNKEATLVKLAQAIVDLRDAEAAGADVGALIALLEQVIASVEAT